MDLDETAFLKYAKSKLEGDFHVIDVGAASGAYTLAAQEAFPNATFHAFEPTPDHYAACANNLDNVFIHNAVVGAENHNGVSFVVVPVNQEWSYVDTIIPDDGIAITVPMVRLDSYIAGLVGEVGIVKIDTEGYEYQCIDGLEDAFDRVKFIQIEYGGTWGREERLTGRSINHLLDTMHNKGFNVYVFNGQGLVHIHPDDFNADGAMRNIFFENRALRG